MTDIFCLDLPWTDNNQLNQCLAPLSSEPKLATLAPPSSDVWYFSNLSNVSLSQQSCILPLETFQRTWDCIEDSLPTQPENDAAPFPLSAFGASKRSHNQKDILGNYKGVKSRRVA